MMRVARIDQQVGAKTLRLDRRARERGGDDEQGILMPLRTRPGGNACQFRSMSTAAATSRSASDGSH